MSEHWKRDAADEIRSLIEKVDGQLREAEQLRSYASDRHQRPAFFPERRKTPRLASPPPSYPPQQSQ